jgi:plastocyanin
MKLAMTYKEVGMTVEHSARRARKTWPVTLIAALLVILVVAVFAAACGGGTSGTTATTAGAAPGGGAQVTLQNIQISPTSVTIKAGESVTWTNKDSFTHHLVGDNGEFDSGDLANGATFTFVFKTAGTIAYHCSIHPEMKGTVVVQ